MFTSRSKGNGFKNPVLHPAQLIRSSFSSERKQVNGKEENE